MKQYLYWSDQIAWATNVALLWFVVFVALRRRVARELPWFFTFLCFMAVETSVLLAIGNYLPYKLYFWSFYAGLAGETVLLILVLYEIFLNAFSPLESVPVRTISKLAMTIVLAGAGALAWALWAPAAHSNFPRYVDVLNTLNRSAGIVVACALWSVVMYARSLGIPWRSKIATIAQGFLLNLSVQAIATTVMGYSSRESTIWLSRIDMLVYIACLIIWLRAVKQQEPAVLLPAPDVLKSLRTVVAQMRTQSAALVVMSKTKLREE